jgi:integrase
MHLNTARAAFRIIANDCRLPTRPGCGEPRLHDLRHMFAVNSLIDAHRQGVDVDARLAALSNYLGHVNPANTYWYLTASPALMTIVSDRISAYQKRGQR